MTTNSSGEAVPNSGRRCDFSAKSVLPGHRKGAENGKSARCSRLSRFLRHRADHSRVVRFQPLVSPLRASSTPREKGVCLRNRTLGTIGAASSNHSRECGFSKIPIRTYGGHYRDVIGPVADRLEPNSAYPSRTSPRGIDVRIARRTRQRGATPGRQRRWKMLSGIGLEQDAGLKCRFNGIGASKYGHPSTVESFYSKDSEEVRKRPQVIT
jgi:hypothetical protein